MALRIFVADDHEVVRRGICALLTSHSGWEVCGEASNGGEAVDNVAHLKPDIVILDISMPTSDGLEAAYQILHHNPCSAQNHSEWFCFLMVVVPTIAKGQSRSVPFLIKMYEFETDLSARGVNNCSDWLEF